MKVTVLIENTAPEGSGLAFEPGLSLYIEYNGKKVLLDAGISGKDNVGQIRTSVVTGCGSSGVVRILLFLAVLGTCGLAADNAATILAAGNRTAAGPTVPPGGLYMTHLWYDDGIEKFECPIESL